MKRLRRLAIPVFLIVLIFGGLSAQPVLAEEPIDPPAPLTIGAEPDYPPYSMLDDRGEPTGFSIALFEAVARAMGRTVEIEPGLWNDIKTDLAEGRLDALPLVGRTPEREEILDFTIPYLSLYGGIVVREGEADIRQIDDLAGHTVAVMRGDNAEEFLLRQDAEIDLVPVPTFLDALELVAAGGADAVVMQRLVALRLLQQGAVPGLKLADEPIEEFRQDFCFAVTEGDKELLAELNEGLALLIADGTFRRLQTEWFGAIELPSRKIVIGGDYDYPPFEFLDESGRPAGYNVDLARAIAEELGIAIEIRLGPWAQITRLLERGEIDLIMGMMYSSERDRVFDFSQAHTVHQHVVIGRGEEGAVMPSTPDALQDVRIVVQNGDVMHDFAVEHSLGEELLVVDSQEEALRLVADGGADYALAGRITAMRLIDRNGWDNLIVGREELASHEYGFAVREGDEALLSYFSEGLAVIEESGEYRRIYDRWLGMYQPVARSTEDTMRVVGLILLPVLLLLIGTIIWNRLLRRRVSRATVDLRESEMLYRLLSENTVDVVWFLSSELNIRYVNPAVEAMTGRGRNEWIGKSVRELFDEATYRDLSRRVEIARNTPRHPGDRSSEFSLETRVTTHVGEAVEVGVSGKLLWNEDGSLDGLQGIARNITDRKKYEGTLMRSITEKETLLKEIHHRVKNNLNVIVSLLRLQEDHVESVESARNAFRESRNRIFSMALVHEALYRSESFSEIALDGYIRELMEQLAENVPEERRVSYALQLDPLLLDISRAVPCGIIINELVTNAQKHAFRGRESGEILIVLRVVPEKTGIGHHVTLTVSDDGVGFPPGVDPVQTTSLGLKLVTVLAEQISAELSVGSTAEDGGGACVSVTFGVDAAESE